jgi:hypothetical protein
MLCVAFKCYGGYCNFYCNAECRYTECRYGECRGAERRTQMVAIEQNGGDITFAPPRPPSNGTYLRAIKYENVSLTMMNVWRHKKGETLVPGMERT